MWLSNLTVRNCRIIKEATLSLSPDINFIYGSNGSGKSSLLEAISILSIGRSFRTSRIAEVIRYEEEALLSTSIVSSEDFENKRIGIEKSTSKTLIRVNKQNIQSQSELSKILPISIIHPLSHELITGGSLKRRRFIDWLAFYKYPEFHHQWKLYQTLLKQRNAALKDPKLYYALEHLTYELCKLQQPIHSYRQQALEKLKQTIEDSIPSFLIEQSAQLTLKTGLPKDIGLDADSLVNYYNSKLSYEKLRGRTVQGVHCSDIVINLNGMPAVSSASRGQSKLLSLLLHIAQNITITQQGIIAIDDLAAEIDESNYRKLIDFVPSLNRQVIITSTHKPEVLPNKLDYSMFHVKHGEVTKE